MKCYECKRQFYFKRKFTTLFKEEREYLCENCYTRFPIHLQTEDIMLEDYHAIILSMFDKGYKIDYNLFFHEYSKIFQSLSLKKGYRVIFLDKVYLNDEFIETLDVISKLYMTNIYILCFTMHN